MTAGAGSDASRRPVAAVVALACLLSAGGGCGRAHSPGGAAAEPVPEVTIVLSAAVSLGPALREAISGFGRLHPECAVQLNTGGSALLARQIERGARVDVFAAASPLELDALARAGHLLDGTRIALASNALVVIVPRGRPAPAYWNGLAEARFARIAAGNPRTAPLGRYTHQSLLRIGLLDVLEPRLVYALDARQALEYVARGDVDAGIVYRSDIRLAADRVTAGPELPAESHDPIVYEAAVLRESTRSQVARALVAYLASDEGLRRFDARGFLPPPGRER